MALKSLSTAQMVELSQGILQPGSAPRKVLDAIDGGSALLGQLQRGYDGLLAAQPPPNTALAKLVAEMAALDARHDRLVRALLWRVESEIVLAEGDDVRRSLGELKDGLFPIGAAITQKSYVDEAGEGKLREARVTAPMHKTLGKLKFHDGRSGEQLYELLQQTAAAIGAGEKKRAELGAAGDVVTKSGAARNQWIRAVSSIAAFLHAEGIDETPILGAIREAEAKADREPGSDTDPGVAPAPGGGGPT